MGNVSISAQRVVIGGGLFGCYAALVLADKGFSVIVVEQEIELLSRASLVNQARLHTGLHYPRSMVTAQEAYQNYKYFRSRFAHAIHDFSQIYAVAARNSLTSGRDFEMFIKRLGINADPVDPELWFHSGTVSKAFIVEEPSFDISVIRQTILKELHQRPSITVLKPVAAIGGNVSGSRVEVRLSDDSTIYAEGLVIASYASTNGLREVFGLPPIPLKFELAEVLLGTVGPDLEGIGVTVMDGPFWSLMPFGKSGNYSLTSVGYTPLRSSVEQPRFDCQERRLDCNPVRLQDCTTCDVRPRGALEHHRQQMSYFLKSAASFEVSSSMLTVKAVLQSTEVDDARPTLIHKDQAMNVTTILSGKVSTLFDLDSELA